MFIATICIFVTVHFCILFSDVFLTIRRLARKNYYKRQNKKIKRRNEAFLKKREEKKKARILNANATRRFNSLSGLVMVDETDQARSTEISNKLINDNKVAEVKDYLHPIEEKLEISSDEEEEKIGQRRR